MAAPENDGDSGLRVGRWLGPRQRHAVDDVHRDAADAFDADPLGTQPPYPDPFDADPLGGQPLGVDPLGGQPLGTQPPYPDPLGVDPLGGQPLGVDPLGVDPLGIDPSGAEPPGIDPSGDALPEARGPWRSARPSPAAPADGPISDPTVRMPHLGAPGPTVPRDPRSSRGARRWTPPDATQPLPTLPARPPHDQTAGHASPAGEAGATGTSTARRATTGPTAPSDANSQKPQPVADLPPVSIRGLPIFLAVLLALGALAIVAMLAIPHNRSEHTVAPQVSTTEVIPNLGLPTALPTGASAGTAATRSPSAAPSDSSTPSARPSPTYVLLGALTQARLSAYCTGQGAGRAALTKAAQGTDAAINNWECTRNKQVRSFIIDTTKACRYSYGASATAGYLNRDDAYSWRCYR